MQRFVLKPKPLSFAVPRALGMLVDASRFSQGTAWSGRGEACEGCFRAAVNGGFSKMLTSKIAESSRLLP